MAGGGLGASIADAFVRRPCPLRHDRPNGSTVAYDRRRGRQTRGIPVSAKGTPATEALRRAGIAHEVHEYTPEAHRVRRRAERPNYGVEAAAALGVEPERVFKTLIAAVDDDSLIVAVVPVSRDLDLKRVAAAAAGRRAALADPVLAERATGYVVGGISPIGQRRRLPTLIDASAVGHPTILVSAGRRGLQVEMTTADLAALTNAKIIPIAK